MNDIASDTSFKITTMGDVKQGDVIAFQDNGEFSDEDFLQNADWRFVREVTNPGVSSEESVPNCTFVTISETRGFITYVQYDLNVPVAVRAYGFEDTDNVFEDC